MILETSLLHPSGLREAFYLFLGKASSSSSLQFPSSRFSHPGAPPLTQALGFLGRCTLPLLGHGLLDSVKRNKIFIWKYILWRISSTIPLKEGTTRCLCSLESDHVWCRKFKDLKSVKVGMLMQEVSVHCSSECGIKKGSWFFPTFPEYVLKPPQLLKMWKASIDTCTQTWPL